MGNTRVQWGGMGWLVACRGQRQVKVSEKEKQTRWMAKKDQGRIIHQKKRKWFLEKNGFHPQICFFSILYNQKSYFLTKMTFISLRIGPKNHFLCQMAPKTKWFLPRFLSS